MGDGCTYLIHRKSMLYSTTGRSNFWAYDWHFHEIAIGAHFQLGTRHRNFKISLCCCLRQRHHATNQTALS